MGWKLNTLNSAATRKMVAVVRAEAAQYDIVVPSGGTVAEMIEEELLQPLDHSLIPNMANVMETFLEPPYDPDNEYSLPYQWGTIGIGYDTTIFDADEMTSWADFLAYEGRVAWLDDTDAILGISFAAPRIRPQQSG